MAKTQNRIFSLGTPKAEKAQAYGWLNAIHYMAPASLSGFNLCPWSTASCRALCLGWESGQAGMVANDSDVNSVRASRIAKAKRFMKDRDAYMADVVVSIIRAQWTAGELFMQLCVRMNGATDIGWEGIKVKLTDALAKALRRMGAFRVLALLQEGPKTLMQLFPMVQFVDYTKSPKRAIACASGKFPANYSLCFSRTETNEADCIRVLDAGGTVAAVFATQAHETWNGFPIIDGDTHDLRHLDPRGHVVGLSPKGRKAKKDQSGFVIR